ncbi:hypothetical protein NIES2119_22085 [[Phormidium ambiguum] IAM M-71]|uniref:SH3b domain-containing protein n=1 Tax=[Phormidium ambiguum] IAM M-71 TaxID=454136 RepID=A0A1U7IAZ3_9CYAN|nr:hypothetical protein [Phormidium ambiguum]OKH33801.1 hypothetical protein NIES2119_22085 [Phormidium ambiguum IAM M-71]
MFRISILSLLIFTGLGISVFGNPARADIYDATVICRVRGLQQGQLALRPQPNGRPFAGLNNGNTVQAFAGTIDENNVIWDEVKVIKGPNSQLTGRVGYVNSKYLSCKWYDEQGNFIREDP